VLLCLIRWLRPNCRAEAQTFNPKIFRRKPSKHSMQKKHFLHVQLLFGQKLEARLFNHAKFLPMVEGTPRWKIEQ